MSRVDRLVGIARSLAIYHAIPWRQRRMRRLYASFVEPGDLVFDIGAHVGNRDARLRGARLPGDRARTAARLRAPAAALFGRSPRVEIVEAAVGARPGKASLSISERTPTVTTLAPGWREARSREPDFGGVRWNRRIDVETTTLDVLIARCGVPAFVKIDVEGGEPAVLAGLTQAVPALSFEYVPAAHRRGAGVRRSAGRARAVSLQLVGRRIVPARVRDMAERGRADGEPRDAARPPAIRRRLRAPDAVKLSSRLGVSNLVIWSLSRHLIIWQCSNEQMTR